MDEPGGEIGHGDVAMLAREITDLTSLWLTRVTRRLLRTLVGIQMCQCTRAVAVRRDRRIMDMVD